jgi:hypothetical protein
MNLPLTLEEGSPLRVTFVELKSHRGGQIPIPIQAKPQAKVTCLRDIQTQEPLGNRPGRIEEKHRPKFYHPHRFPRVLISLTRA